MRVHLLITALLLGMTSGSLRAAPEDQLRWYRIEMLIFSQNRDALYDELWSATVEPMLPQEPVIQLASGDDISPAKAGNESADAIAAQVDGNTAPSLAEADPPQLITPHTRPELYASGARTLLANEVPPAWNEKALARRGYRPLWRASWIQPLREEQDAIAVFVRSDEQTSTGVPVLLGTLKFYLSRYIHLRTDLYYSRDLPPGWVSLRPEPADTTQTTAPELTGSDGAASLAPGSFTPEAGAPQLMAPERPRTLTVRMTQGRRMRSGELHYLDHPMLGVLVRLTPQEPPEPAAEISADGEAPAEQPASAAIELRPQNR